MTLPIELTLPPMEAQSVATLPAGPGWQYEPKFDGFRCLAFRDGDMVALRSKSGQVLERYFPDVAAALATLPARRFVLDGELVIAIEGRLSFESLQLRLHPAASRVKMLAAAHPAVMVAFDLLLDVEGEPLLALPLAERRPRLERFFARLGEAPAVQLAPVTTERDQALAWLDELQADVDGIIAKRLDEPYRTGERAGMVKWKRKRTADCVVGGFRYNQGTDVVGSLLLGLYDKDGLLHHVGHSSSLKAADKPALTKKLEALIEPPGFTGRAPGGPSRWSTERTGQWQPLKPELVVEVEYDHVTDQRFRHGARLLRWRPDKAPRQCDFAQIGL